MKLKFYELEGNEPEILLRALLSGLRPDGIRMILRGAINSKISEYEKTGAAFLVRYDNNSCCIRVICVNHSNLDRQDLDRLDTLEDLYNTIDEWGVE